MADKPEYYLVKVEGKDKYYVDAFHIYAGLKSATWSGLSIAFTVTELSADQVAKLKPADIGALKTRYQTEPVFHYLVDAMVMAVRSSAGYSVSDVQDALSVAREILRRKDQVAKLKEPQ